MLDARRARLESEFRGKFGWLLGNLYSRAASPDWADTDGGADKRKALIDDLLQEKSPGMGPLWIDDDNVAAARDAAVVFDNRAQADVMADLLAHRPAPRIEQAADIAVKELERLYKPNDFAIRAARQRLEDKAAAALEGLGTTEQSGTVQKAMAEVVDAAIHKAKSNPAAELRTGLRAKAASALHGVSMSDEQLAAVNVALAAVIDAAVLEVHPVDQLAKYRKKLANSGSLRKLLK